ncbi:MAG: ABC transporter permease [Thermoplasmata archaeon]
MNTKNIKIIFSKDMEELLSLNIVKFSIIFFPILFLFILSSVLVISFYQIGHMSSIPLSTFPAGTGDIHNIQIFYYLALNYLILLSVVPLGLSTTIASYSIVGEKQQRTIEPLLATPLDDRDLFFGKLLAPLIPTLIASYISIFIYTLIADYLSSSLGKIIFPDTQWIIIVFIFIPSSTALEILFTLLFSSRVTDPRSAQQISGMIILPIIIVFILSLFYYSYEPILLLILTFSVILADVIIFRIAVRLFDRERIITRWV